MQNTHLMRDSSLTYTAISSASGPSFENFPDQSGLASETKSSTSNEYSSKKRERKFNNYFRIFFYQKWIN